MIETRRRDRRPEGMIRSDERKEGGGRERLIPKERDGEERRRDKGRGEGKEERRKRMR